MTRNRLDLEFKLDHSLGSGQSWHLSFGSGLSLSAVNPFTVH